MGKMRTTTTTKTRLHMKGWRSIPTLKHPSHVGVTHVVEWSKVEKGAFESPDSDPTYYLLMNKWKWHSKSARTVS
jgi:hypothetical protein